MCTIPVAVVVQAVSATSSASVDSVSMQVAGGVGQRTECSGSVCMAWGSAGAYALTISAPGYQAAHLDVTVHDGPPAKCGCSGVTTERRTVALVPVGATN